MEPFWRQVQGLTCLRPRRARSGAARGTEAGESAKRHAPALLGHREPAVPTLGGLHGRGPSQGDWHKGLWAICASSLRMLPTRLIARDVEEAVG